jgi:vacuolar protein sorting-associated protein IST1
VLSKLKIEAPPQLLVSRYLREIARTYDIQWSGGDSTPSPEPSDNEHDDEGNNIFSEKPTKESSVDVENREPAVSIAPPSPSTENIHPILNIPPSTRPAGSRRKSSLTAAAPSAGSKPVSPPESKEASPSIDDLMKRFEALKRRS